MTIIDDELNQAIRQRLKRLVREALGTHLEEALTHPRAEKVAELYGYAHGVVTDHEPDLKVGEMKIDAAIRRGAQVGRTMRKVLPK